MKAVSWTKLKKMVVGGAGGARVEEQAVYSSSLLRSCSFKRGGIGKSSGGSGSVRRNRRSGRSRRGAVATADPLVGQVNEEENEAEGGGRARSGKLLKEYDMAKDPCCSDEDNGAQVFLDNLEAGIVVDGSPTTLRCGHKGHDDVTRATITTADEEGGGDGKPVIMMGAATVREQEEKRPDDDCCCCCIVVDAQEVGRQEEAPGGEEIMLEQRETLAAIKSSTRQQHQQKRRQRKPSVPEEDRGIEGVEPPERFKSQVDLRFGLLDEREKLLLQYQSNPELLRCDELEAPVARVLQQQPRKDATWTRSVDSAISRVTPCGCCCEGIEQVEMPEIMSAKRQVGQEDRGSNNSSLLELYRSASSSYIGNLTRRDRLSSEIGAGSRDEITSGSGRSSNQQQASRGWKGRRHARELILSEQNLRKAESCTALVEGNKIKSGSRRSRRIEETSVPSSMRSDHGVRKSWRRYGMDDYYCSGESYQEGLESSSRQDCSSKESGFNDMGSDGMDGASTLPGSKDSCERVTPVSSSTGRGTAGGTKSSGWAKGFADRLFRKKEPKIALSVSREGYFQRTNFRRSGTIGAHQVKSHRRSSRRSKRRPNISKSVIKESVPGGSSSVFSINEIGTSEEKLPGLGDKIKRISASFQMIVVPGDRRRATAPSKTKGKKKGFDTVEVRLPRLRPRTILGCGDETCEGCRRATCDFGAFETSGEPQFQKGDDDCWVDDYLLLECSKGEFINFEEPEVRVEQEQVLERSKGKMSWKLGKLPGWMKKKTGSGNKDSGFALPRPAVSMGDITQKGYEKKKSRLLGPYVPKQHVGPKTNEGSASPSTRAKRRAHRRLTRNESRYHSEVRQEAVQQALAAMQGRPKPSLPMPSKRTSVMGKTSDLAQHDSGDSSSEDDSVGNEDGDGDDQDSSIASGRDREKESGRPPAELPGQPALPSDSSSNGSATRPPKLPERNRNSNGSSAGPVLTYSNLGNLSGGNLGWEERPSSERRAAAEPQLPPKPAPIAETPPQLPQLPSIHRNSRPEITDLVEAMNNLRSNTAHSTPPDVTSTAQSRRLQPADRLNRLNTKRGEDTSGTLTGTGRWKVSAKIQQLLNTLKRPKRRPLPEFYEDDDIELEMAAKHRDPNAPKPEGSVMSPAVGEQLVIPSGLPRNLEAAVQRYGSATFKAPVATVLDPNGKLTITLSYGKLLSRSHKIAFALLNKTGNKGESLVKTGDRVALVYPNNDPINFLCTFYGCLFAGVVPVPIEVPLTRRDAGSQQIGFLLGSCNVAVALTSEACLKGLPKTATGEVVTFKGWPKLLWFVTEHQGKAPKDWTPSPRVTDETAAYIEVSQTYTTDKDGSVMGVTVNRASMLAHCRSLTTACNYTEGEVMVCVLDFKREVGLWHSILTAVFNGMHVIFIPYALMKVNPASWMQMITKYRASIAIVKSRDLHWGLLATRDHRDISLASLRLLLVSDGANPWSLSSCDQFLSVFQNKGLRSDAICPCASSSEVLTVSLRRPGRAGVNATGRGVLSMQGLSYGVVRVDQENSLTSLTLQDCGQVMPGAVIVVVRMDGQPYLCKTDEVGEICVHSSATGSHYWGLQGLTNQTFKVQPLQPDNTAVSDSEYVRSGLLGFLGPGGLVFVCGSRNGLTSVSGRKHNADDIIATVLAVEPMKFIYRGRIAVFSIKVLRDERICVIAEQRPDCSEEESFQWMSRVLQAVDSIHQVGIYCLVLVNPNCLPKTPLGGIHLSETKRRFLEGSLHPANVLMCPHTCVTNLPKPREIHSDVGPASVMVGNIVQGNRLASAQGRDLGVVDEESDTAKKYQFISEILKWRSTSTADHVIFTLLNSKGTATLTLTCSQLHKRAERVANLLLDRAKINKGDHVALVYPPGLDLVVAFYGCLYAGVVPVTVRPPHPQNLQTTLPTVRMIAEVSKSVLILSTQSVVKLLKSKEASNVVDIKSWPLTLDTDDLPKKKLPNPYRPPTAEMIAYLDFSVSTTGMLAGIKMSHSAVTSLCRSMKLACELYPSRHVALCLDPYCGLGFALWCLSSVYSGHHSILIPPSEVEANPALWLSAVSQYKVRDTFCSYGVMELCTKGLGSSVNLLKQRNVNLACVRTCVVVAEERPRINLTNSFSKLFSALGLSPRAVSTSFGCRVNVGICLQGASSPEPSMVYVDLRALRNDRVTLVERGSPHSLCLMESGKLLPGSKVIIANPDTKGQCGDSHLGEIWVQSPHNASGYFTIFGDESSYADHFSARLVTGSTGDVYARTGYLGFLRRTENVQADGELHDAVFVVGALDETIMLRGMRYHPIDIENSILRCHKKIAECAVFSWTNLLVVVVELEGNENEALDVVPLVTNCVLEEHHLVVGVVVVVDPGVVPINSRGEKQRMHLRDGFLADQLDPIFVAYNM